MARHLRIAVSIFFGVLCATYCVLWVMDRWRFDGIGGGQITYSPAPGATIVVLPYWCIALIAGMFAIRPWRGPLQFSLRTLLIATTLVAVVLGLAVWAGR